MSVTSNPFPGLRPFTQEEDYLFFGREEQTIELLKRLSSHRFVAVVGTSGSGKSSLVRCGLLSELLGGKMLKAGAAWEIAVTHPGGNPLGLLAESLVQADLYDAEEENVRENLLATLSRSHFGLVEAIRQAGLGEDTNFLLVVDQFEEVFRFHEAGQSQKEAAAEFVSLLLEAVAQTDVPIYVVLTMRSDFIGECGQFEGLAEMVNRGEFLIPRLNREQYKRVIEGPIKVARGQITPRLLQRLLNDLGQQADQLPCLQHALMRTWSVRADKGDSEPLDLSDYERVGKMAQGLSLHADEVYHSLATDRQRELCRQLFQALTVQESENRGIRRPQRLGSLCQILDVEIQELVPVIDAFRQSGVTFLMPAPDVELTPNTIVDISHESLMRVWTRLRNWVQEEAQAAGIYRRLSESAELHTHGKMGLFRDPELGITLAWREETRPNLAWAERYRPGFEAAMQFLEASERAAVAEAEAREAARQRELAQAQKLAEVQQRAARRLRWMVAGLAAVALLAMLATIGAVNARQSADAARVAAVASESLARQNAERAAQEAERAELEARRAAQEAERARTQEAAAKQAEEEATAAREAAEAANEAFEQQLYLSDMTLADHSYGDGNVHRVTETLLDHMPGAAATDDPRGFEWYHLWAGAHRVSATFEPERRENPQGPRRFPLPVLALAVAPGGDRAAASYRDGIAVFDTASREALAVLASAGMISDNACVALAFSPDGKLIEAVTEQGELLGWDAQSLAPLGSTRAAAALSSISFSPTEPLLVAGGVDGRLYFWTTDPWQSRDRSDPIAGSIRNVAFSPDGTRIAVGIDGLGDAEEDGQPTVVLWDVSRGEVVATASAHNGRVAAVAWEPQGRFLAAAGEEGALQIWDTDLKPVHTLHDLGPVPRIVVSPDGSLMASSSGRSNTVEIVGTDNWELVTELKGPSSGVAALAFLHSDTLLVGGDDGQLQVWDVDRAMREPVEVVRDELLQELLATSDRVWIGAQGQTIYCWSSHASIQRYDLGSRRILSPWDDGTAFAVSNLSDGGRFLATITPQRELAVWDLETAETLYQAKIPADGELFGVTISRNGTRVAWLGGTGDPSGGADLRTGIHDVQTGERLEFDYGSWGGFSQQLSADGKRLFARRTVNVDVFDIEQLSAAAEVPESVSLQAATSPHTMITSPDGQLIAALASSMLGGRIANSMKGIQLNDVAGNALHNLTGHSGPVNCGTFSPDSRRFVSGGQDGTLRVWNVQTGDLLLTLREHAGPVHAVAFAADGSLVSLSRADGRVRIWHAPKKEVLESDPTLWTELAEHRVSVGDLDGALSAYDQARRLLTDSTVVDRIHGDLALQGGLTTTALNDYLRVIANGVANSQLIETVLQLAALEPLVANREERLLTWRYTMTEPDTRWNQPEFDASSWEVARGPFGNELGDRTYWQNGHIWLRLEFDLERLPDVPLVMRTWNDDGAEFYFNGVLAQSRNYSGRRYRQWRLNRSSVEALRPGRNLLAIHCLDTGGATARIDAALYADHGWNAVTERLTRELESDKENVYLLHERMLAYRRSGNSQAATADGHRLVGLLRERVDAQMEQHQVATPKEVEILARAVLARGATEVRGWRVIAPFKAESTRGATLSLLPDNSILASGENPSPDAYEIELRTDLEQVTAIRLEALTHDSLPAGGPGRAADPLGNFVMQGWDVYAGSNQAAGELTRVKFSNAWADLRSTPRPLVQGHWNIWQAPGSGHTAIFQLESPIRSPNGVRLTFNIRFQGVERWPHQNLGRFRISVTDDPTVYGRTKLLETVQVSGDGWHDLAAAYYLVGDETALDRLLAQQPEAAAGLGDLFAAQASWQPALDAYNRAISPETKDASLFARRSRVYAEMGQRGLADTDLARAVDLSNRPQRDFADLRMQRDWRSAAAFGWRLMELTPGDSLLWLKLGATLALGGDREGYQKLCEIIAAHESPRDDDLESGRATKACLLLPGVVELDMIPAALLEEALDAGRGDRRWRTWAWPARGLLAYRRGDAEAALRYSDTALAQEPGQLQRTLALTVRALALTQLDRWTEAAADVSTVSEIVERQLDSIGRGQIHDVHIPLILMREAEALLASREKQHQQWAASGEWKPIAEDLLQEFDSLEERRAGWGPRCRFLQQILQRGDGVFAALSEVRPDETLFALVEARDLALREDWEAAVEAFARGVSDTPEQEEYYEYAAALLLAGRHEAYREIVSQLGRDAEASGQPFDQYAAARAAVLVEEPPVDSAQMLKWAKQAAQRDPQPWRRHVLGLAHFRAANLQDAAQIIAETRDEEGWNHELQDIALCLIHLARGDDRQARRYRSRVEQWMERTAPARAEGGGRENCTDWLELHVLLGEADAKMNGK